MQKLGSDVDSGKITTEETPTLGGGLNTQTVQLRNSFCYLNPASLLPSFLPSKIGEWCWLREDNDGGDANFRRTPKHPNCPSAQKSFCYLRPASLLPSSSSLANFWFLPLLFYFFTPLGEWYFCCRVISSWLLHFQDCLVSNTEQYQTSVLRYWVRGGLWSLHTPTFLPSSPYLHSHVCNLICRRNRSNIFKKDSAT